MHNCYIISYKNKLNDFTPSILTPTDQDVDWAWLWISWQWYIILQVIAAVIGIIGNSLVMVVIFQRRRAARETDLLIGHLAIADLLTSIFIIPQPYPTQIPNNWLGMLYCLVLYPGIFLWVPVTASAYILMAISVERYIAVVYPIRFNHLVTNKRVKWAVFLIWIAAILSILFSFFVIEIDEGINYCSFKIETQEGLTAMGLYWFSLRIIVPTSTMIVTQSLIAVALTRQSTKFKNNAGSTSNSYHITARNRVLRVAFEIIVIYIVCWTPNQVAFLGFVVGFVPPTYLNSPLHHSLTVLGFVNSCANPVIYTIRHPHFRTAIVGLFTGRTTKATSVFGIQRVNVNKCVQPGSHKTLSSL